MIPPICGIWRHWSKMLAFYLTSWIKITTALENYIQYIHIYFQIYCSYSIELYRETKKIVSLFRIFLFKFCTFSSNLDLLFEFRTFHSCFVPFIRVSYLSFVFRTFHSCFVPFIRVVYLFKFQTLLKLSMRITTYRCCRQTLTQYF